MKKQFIVSAKEMANIRSAIESIQSIRFYLMPETNEDIVGRKERKLLVDQLWAVMDLLKKIESK